MASHGSHGQPPATAPRHGLRTAAPRGAHDALGSLADQHSAGAAGRALEQVVAVVHGHLQRWTTWATRALRGLVMVQDGPKVIDGDRW